MLRTHSPQKLAELANASLPDEFHAYTTFDIQLETLGSSPERVEVGLSLPATKALRRGCRANGKTDWHAFRAKLHVRLGAAKDALRDAGFTFHELGERIVVSSLRSSGKCPARRTQHGCR